MVSDGGESSVTTNVRLSSVVPATVTGEGKVRELTGTDLAVKLHYLRGVYFFPKEAVQDLTISDFKKPMFQWLQLFFPAAGRIRRSEKGRPIIKCNDGGVRIVEARCEKSIEEWLATEDHGRYHATTYDQVLGPDLAFSPLVFIQFTRFKCGGVSVGLSWAHVLGDVVSATGFINAWGMHMAGHPLPDPSLHVIPPPSKPKFPHHDHSQKPIALKMTEPVGDHWLLPRSDLIGTHYFHVSLDQLRASLSGPSAQSPPFPLLSAIMWKTLAKIRGGGESAPKIATVCTDGRSSERRAREIPKNGMAISSVEAGAGVAEADVSDLAKLIAEKAVCENGAIDEAVDRDDGKSDFVLYGGNLTLVNLEEVELFGLEIKGRKPIWAGYSIGGVGEEGVFLVLPAREGDGGRTVAAMLPENELAWLRRQLRDDWCIV